MKSAIATAKRAVKDMAEDNCRLPFYCFLDKEEALALCDALLEAEKVIRDHSGGMWHRCDGNWDWANEWLKKYAGEK